MRMGIILVALLLMAGMSATACSRSAPLPTPTQVPLGAGTPNPNFDLWMQGLQQYSRDISRLKNDDVLLEQHLASLQDTYTSLSREEAAARLQVLAKQMDDLLLRMKGQGLPEIRPSIPVTSTVAVYYAYLKVFQTHRRAMDEFGKTISTGDVEALSRAKLLEADAVRFAKEADQVYADFLRDYSVPQG